MSSRAVISALFICVACAASAADWGTVAADSDRTLDSALLAALHGEDLDTKALICTGVGKRADPFAGDIITALMESDAGKTGDIVEILLRMILQGLFDPSKGPNWTSERVKANRDALIPWQDGWRSGEIHSLQAPWCASFRSWARREPSPPWHRQDRGS